MQLSPRISELVRAYRATESDDRRGPRFKEVALALEQEAKTSGVSEEMLLECFGVPDLWDEKGGEGFFVYFFDHEEPGRDSDEWYFHLAERRLTNSGYNTRGINDHSSLKPGSKWPQRDA